MPTGEAVELEQQSLGIAAHDELADRRPPAESDDDHEQCGSTEHHAHAGDQSKVYPLLGEWVVGGWFFRRILIQAVFATKAKTQMRVRHSTLAFEPL